MELIQEFEGFVEHGTITENGFTARIFDKTCPDNPEMGIDILKSSIPEEEREYIQDGFLFEWKVYEEKGKKKYISEIKFHKEEEPIDV